MFTILLTGQDTTASTDAWVEYCMSFQSAAQRKVQQEVDADNFDLLQVDDASEVEEVFAFAMVPRNLRVELRRRG